MHLPLLSALVEWKPYSEVPFTKEQLLREIASLSAALIPAADEEYVTEVVGLIRFANAFGIQCQDPQAVHAAYRELFRTLPADLLKLAMMRLRETWTWRNMPLPAEILNFVGAELTLRQVALRKARLALKKTNKRTPST